MTFPKRLLDDDGASSAMRDVLRSGRGMDPPDGAENAVWLALSAKIAAGAAVAAATTATAKTAAAATTTTATATSTTAGAVASTGLLKAILIGAFGGVIAVTGYSALEPSSPPSPSPESAVVAPAPTKDRLENPAPRGPLAAPSPGAGDTSTPAENRPAPSTSAAQPSIGASSSATGDAPSSATAEPAPASTDASGAAGASSPVPGSPEDRASRLREESDMLNQARAALRGGDTAGTMRLISQAAQKFPNGVLGQEREALAIEALAKSGASDEASRRAAAFIQAHPNSPHAARLQVFVH